MKIPIMDSEDILDSGQINESSNEHMEYLPELDLTKKKFENIEWKPISEGGASFKTHRLVYQDGETLRFVAKRGTWLFGSIFFLPVIVLFFLSLSAIIHNVPYWNVISALFFLLFFIMIVTLVESMIATSIFDKNLGLFWKKRPTISRVLNPKGNFVVNLEDIQAIQILKQNIRSKNKTYVSYEINLVLDNNQRLSVVDQGDEKGGLEDAQALANYLEVPLLNGIDR